MRAVTGSLLLIALLATGLVAQQPPASALPQAAAPGPPAFIPLPAELQQYLDQVLDVWERRSNDIRVYRCNFQRWEFDSVFGPADQPKRYSEGQIQYAMPDKGLFRVEKVLNYQAPEQPGGKPKYITLPADYREHWICDGNSIWEFDEQRKVLVQQLLPEELKGKSITQGPLPFLFRAEADVLRRRYWIRAITPDRVQKTEIWLEAYPRTMQDSANFLKVHIIIDRKTVLPRGLVIFDRNYQPGRNSSRTVFSFNDREVNYATPITLPNVFQRHFYEPAIPSGWRKEVRPAPVVQANRPVQGQQR